MTIRAQHCRDREVIQASLHGAMEPSVVLPASRFEATRAHKPYTTATMLDAYLFGIHGWYVLNGGVVDVVDLRDGAAVLPFADNLWLFRPRVRPLTVVLPDGQTVVAEVARAYARKTPQWASWCQTPALAQPWTVAPTAQLLDTTLRCVK